MKKQNEQMPVRYKQLGSEQRTDFYFERSLDLIFSPGAFTVEIDHTSADVGLPVEYCGAEHYIVGTLIVTDSGTSLPIQTNRTIGQILSITSCESRDTKLYTRTFVNGTWSEWRALVCTGMYDNISTTDELITTVEELVSESKTIQAKITNEIGRATEVDLAINTDIGYLILEQGGISLTSGNLDTNTARVRTKAFLKAPFRIELNPDYSVVGIVKYNQAGIKISSIYPSFANIAEIADADEFLYKFSIKRNDGTKFNSNEEIVASYEGGLKGYILQIKRDLNSHSTKITEAEQNLLSISNNFQIEKLVGIVPSITKIEILTPSDSGEIGLSLKDLSYTDNTYLRITTSHSQEANYSIFAAVLYGNDVPENLIFEASSTTKIGFWYNRNTNANYRNTLSNGLIDLGRGKYLAYIIAGKFAYEGTEMLPTTAYLRIPMNVTFNLAVEKILIIDTVDWHDEYIDILKSSVWQVWNGASVLRKTSFNQNIIDDIKDDITALGLERDLSPGIAFWGSSSTEGSWIKNVAANLDMPYYWGGSGGENIWAIMGRMGVLPLRIETPMTIPASASESVELPNNYTLKVRWKGAYKNATIWASSTTSPEKLLINPCYIAGIKGNLIGSGASNGKETLKFQRLEDGDAITTKPYEPIYTLGFRETRDCVWFLACHFNGGQSSTDELVELYRKLYDTSCSKKVLILGRHKTANGTVMSPTLEQLLEQEEALEEEFGLMFFNTREYMCGKGFERFKALYPTDYTSSDAELASQGVPPDCMYENANNVHFNSKGYAILTEAITQRLIELGYNLFRYGGDMKS
ncbi:MAG: hypothetical protein IIW77_04435 [Bacteroidaceae bacterium]|nr:hypothetical protein [Bacteroidaceae bacterium]